MVGSAIGSIFLADLASVTGARYNYGVDNRPVNIFIDEAVETLCDPLLQMLNKGRGQKLNIYLATQTINDFPAKLGDENKAQQFLGNLNNLIALRTINSDTQDFIIKNLPMTRVNYLMRTQGNNTDSGSMVTHGGNVGERLMEEESELFSPQLLGSLPDLEFIAKFAGGRVVKGRTNILTH
jgi:conjugal transfer pilus assembly protein TraD